MTNKGKYPRGVTLVELMIVVLLAGIIFGILTVILIDFNRNSESSLKSGMLWEEVRLLQEAIAEMMTECTHPDNLPASKAKVILQRDKLFLFLKHHH